MRLTVNLDDDVYQLAKSVALAEDISIKARCFASICNWPAWATLKAITEMPDHVFWDDGFTFLDVPHRLIHGHKQVTDAWLAQLARKRGGRLATLDGGLVALHRDVAKLVPV